MVMDCLRNAKRFHATVSFIADTGLTDATDNGMRLLHRLFTRPNQYMHSSQIQPADERFPVKRATLRT